MPDSLLCTISQNSLRKGERRSNPLPPVLGSPASLRSSGNFHQSDLSSQYQKHSRNPQGLFRGSRPPPCPTGDLTLGRAREDAIDLSTTPLPSLEAFSRLKAHLKDYASASQSLSEALVVFNINPSLPHPARTSGGHTLLVTVVFHTRRFPDSHSIISVSDYMFRVPFSFNCGVSVSWKMLK